MNYFQTIRDAAILLALVLLPCLAAPAVAGAAALLYAAGPELFYTEVKSILLAWVDPVPAATDKTVSGGRLNVWAAVCSLSHDRGDATCDGRVRLDDAVLSLQILTGGAVPAWSPCAVIVDVDGDLITGMAEVMYVLQYIAGYR